MVQIANIESFWKDISPLLAKVSEDSEREELINQIDSLVSRFGEYDWEYGPSENSEFYFCLSPNFREELMEEVDKIISMAPAISGWEYVSCKPRKPGVFSWVMHNENEKEITVDSQNWMCVVYMFSDNTIDLDVKIGDLDGNLDTRYMAIDIQLVNVLGERNYIKLVKGIDIVAEFSEEDRQRAIPVNDLFQVLVNP